LVRSEFAQAARTLIIGEQNDGESAKHVAERAEQLFKHLVRHLARLLGDTGVQMLLKRSILQASSKFSWLMTAPGAASMTAMRTAMEQQTPESIAAAFVAILSAFVALLERLIGAGLVDRLLAEVWPSVFTHEPKDTP
jgi:hypothetical protein